MLRKKERKYKKTHLRLKKTQNEAKKKLPKDAENEMMRIKRSQRSKSNETKFMEKL